VPDFAGRALVVAKKFFSGIIKNMRIIDKTVWDYQIKKKDLKDPKILKWYLERKINFGDWSGVKAKELKKYLAHLKIDSSLKKLLIEYFATQ